MYKTFEGFTNFSLYEGIDSTTVQQNINDQKNLAQSIQTNNSNISKNYIDISNNIGAYNTTANYLSANNNIYHYSDQQDPNTIIGYNAPKDIKTAINNDINELKLYQNSICITGVIACATLLLTAILISKK
jgi:pyruvate/oxaloacetate carboxyltransferase